MFILRQILQKYRERQLPTHHLFIDFKAAYDTIDRNELWSIMQRYHFSGKLIQLLEATMNGVQCNVRVWNLTLESFESHRALRLGDGLSCVFFNIAPEGLDNDIRGTILYRSLHLVWLCG